MTLGQGGFGVPWDEVTLVCLNSFEPGLGFHIVLLNDDPEVFGEEIVARTELLPGLRHCWLDRLEA